MANFVENVVKMEGIADLPFYGKDDTGDNIFDFEKILPMPKSLNIVAGGDEDEAIIYYITNRCSVQIDDLPETTLTILHGMLNAKLFGKRRTYEQFNRAKETAEKMSDEEREQLYRDGEVYVSNYIAYGSADWFAWRNKNWGTKWNSCAAEILDPGEIRFMTPYGPPEGILKKLSEMYPDRAITVWWADEDEGCNTGKAVYKNGKSEITEYSNESEEAYDTYSFCWG